ncbi:BMP family ABC transporter substrate-binding protein [Streptomyces sp. NPDC005820]|uniref:BMP family ABC transporter substrate-binding protein n=1 Tax=Streptomyces sp. NPDC005820 TaxID=3157069 RepID=UPI003400FBC4
MNRQSSRVRHAVRRSGRHVAVAAVTSLALVTLAACSGSGSGSKDTKSNGSTSSSVKSVVLVAAQNTGDNGPIDSMNAALTATGKKYGASTRFVYSSDPSAYKTTLQALGRARTSVVVAAFPALQSAVNAVAPSFPDTKWVELYADANKPSLKNVKTVSFDQYKVNYLSGVLAATVSKSGSIGYVGGAVQPGMNADFHAYEAGAKSVNSSIKVIGAFAGSFADPTKGSLIASSQLSKGVDVIDTDAAQTSLGVIKSAQSAGALVITDLGSSVDKQYSDTVIGHVAIDFGAALTKQVDAAAASGWAGGAATSGLEDNVAKLTLSEPFLSGSSKSAAAVKAAQSKLEDIRASIASGKITVPFDTSNI